MVDPQSSPAGCFNTESWSSTDIGNLHIPVPKNVSWAETTVVSPPEKHGLSPQQSLFIVP